MRGRNTVPATDRRTYRAPAPKSGVLQSATPAAILVRVRVCPPASAVASPIAGSGARPVDDGLFSLPAAVLAMDCAACGSPTVVFAVPPGLREHAPAAAERAAVCTRCLTVTPTDAPVEGEFADVSDAFPDGEGAAAAALAVGRLDSLALHREDVAALVGAAEHAGVDVFLLLDRLGDDPSLEPAVDLDRRRTQVEQLL